MVQDGVSFGIQFLHSNITLVLLVIMGLVLMLCFVLLMRRFKAEQYVHAAHTKSAAPLEPASQGTLKQLLQEIQRTPAEGAGPIDFDQLSPKDQARLKKEAEEKASLAFSGGEDSDFAQKLREKESELSKLQSQLKEAKTQLERSKPAAGEDSDARAEINSDEMDALQEKIQELEARLKEYEIIEDDIADLTTYKEENAKLKAELESLQKGEESANTKVATAEKAKAEPVEPEVDPSEDQGAEIPAEPDSEGEETEDETLSASTEQDDSEETPTVDADQLLSEVDDLLTMGEQMSGDSSGLEEDLDTDKILKEASGLPGEKSGT